MELARVTAKGQATIPKRIREAAHIREGDLLAFDLAITGSSLSVLNRPSTSSYQHCKKLCQNGIHLRTMRLGVIFKAFDVVAVPFPFTDREAARRRPALVISNELFNKQHDQLVLAMITTTTNNIWPGDVSLTNLQEAGLKVACHFRIKLFTLDQNLILKTIGHLSPQDVKSTQAVLANYIDVIDSAPMK